MGSEQSRRAADASAARQENERRMKESQATLEQTIRLQEMEAKLKRLERMAQASAQQHMNSTVNSSREGPVATVVQETAQETPKAVERQNQVSQPYAPLINTSANPLMSSPRNDLIRPVTQTSSTERTRSPYSLTKEELQTRSSPTIAANVQSNLYPNLNNRNGVGRSAFNAQPYNMASKASTSTAAEGFEFVDKNGNPQAFAQQPVAQRYQPSAPPAPVNLPVSAPARPRDRSVPRSRPKTSNEDDGLNCPTCKNRYGVTIFQCHRGHSCCRDCKVRGTVCGLCGGFISDTRNRALEDYVSEKKVSCPNAADGCCLMLKLANMETHLKECPFNEMKCPLVAIFGSNSCQCEWKGKISQMASHFEENHPAHRVGSIDKELYLMNYRDDGHILHLIDLGTYNFLVHLKVNRMESMIYMTVQLLGTKASASKWTYDVHVYNKREPRKKFQYTDICNSISTPVEEIFRESKCMTIPLAFARNYVNNNENRLTYKFYITKDVESSNYRGRGRGRGRGHGRGRGRDASATPSV